MTFHPIGVVVMISGPGDTSGEVQAVREEIADWNSQHSVTQGVVFVPKHYSTNAVPIYRKGGDGQAVINEQITNDSDVVIALFKYRLGTPTPRNSKSGTVEEADIKESDGKVHVYFWGGPVPQDVVGTDEWERLGKFREEFHANLRGLYVTYASNDNLREQVRRALWDNAGTVKSAASAGAASLEQSSQLPAVSPTSDVAVSVGLEATVWSAPDLPGLIEHMISEEIREEHEWAARYKQRDSDAHFIPLSILQPGTKPRKPKRVSEISDWADSVRARGDELDGAIAAGAATPVLVNLNSNKILERVEIEIIFEGVLGVEPSDSPWDEHWPELNPIPRHPMDFRIPKLRVAARGPLQAEWAQDGNDVVLTLKLEQLRNRRVPVQLDNTVVLRVPSFESPTSPAFRYTWRASAPGTDHEWTGSGEVTLIDRAASLEKVITWMEQGAD